MGDSTDDIAEDGPSGCSPSYDGEDARRDGMLSADDSIGPLAASGISVLEASGMLDTMLFLRSVGQCKKTDLYRAIGRRVGMAPKLDRLERAGLMIQERHPQMTLLFLTGDGRAVADMIERIRQVIGEGEVREGRSFSPERCRDVTFHRVGGPGRRSREGYTGEGNTHEIQEKQRRGEDGPREGGGNPE